MRRIGTRWGTHPRPTRVESAWLRESRRWSSPINGNRIHCPMASRWKCAYLCPFGRDGLFHAVSSPMNGVEIINKLHVMLQLLEASLLQFFRYRTKAVCITSTMLDRWRPRHLDDVTLPPDDPLGCEQIPAILPSCWISTLWARNRIPRITFATITASATWRQDFGRARSTPRVFVPRSSACSPTVQSDEVDRKSRVPKYQGI